jgi:hypothetical protein
MRKCEMDDDDELKTPGLSGWAGYALGRMAANRERETSETMDALFRRRAPTIDVNRVLAQNRALAAENARLRHSLTEYKLNYEELLRWSDGAEKTIKELRKKTG